MRLKFTARIKFKTKIMKKYIALILFILPPFLLSAQDDSTKGIQWFKLRGIEYSIKAGINVGGTAPIPFPEEIRSIKGYDPTLSFTIEANVTKWFTQKWGMQTGIRLEDKGMITKAKVKNYNLAIIDKDGGYMEGKWTGGVKTKVNHNYLTIPLLATYKLTPRWVLNGGFFGSYMFKGDFSGTAYDGYLRNIDPTGVKVEVDEATYDFSDDLRKFQWGAQLGAEWKAFKHLTVHSNLTWGFNDIFKKDFDTITFNLYPIYLNVGFGYSF